MSDLSELIERVRRLTGPDRGVGRELLLTGGWHKDCYGHFLGPLYMWSSPDRLISFQDDDFREHDPTSSIDAALALQESVLPGCNRVFGDGEPYRNPWCRLSPLSDDGRHPYEAGGVTLPIAIVLAVLLALQEKEQSHDD